MKKKSILIVTGIVLVCLIAGGILLAVFLNQEKQDADAAFRKYLSGLGASDLSMEEIALASHEEFQLDDHYAEYTQLYNHSEALHSDLILNGTFEQVKKELDGFKGNRFAERGGGWYRLKNARSYRYLIHEDEAGKLSVWEFTCFNDDRNRDDEEFVLYTYDKVLSAVYQVASANDIKSITCRPVQSDPETSQVTFSENDEPVVIRDRKDIQTIYSIFGTLECGGRHFAYATTGQDPRYEKDPDPALLRMLTIECTNGTVFDALLFQGSYGTFSDLNDISYKPLSDEDMAVMNRMTGIQK